jgi:hypothetical protein
MGTSSSAPPDDGDIPDPDDEDLELTSVMNVEQQRALRKAARKAAEIEAADPERPTARPLPAAGIAADVAIPKAPAVPTEAVAEIDPPPTPAAPASPTPPEESPAGTGRSIATLAWLGFIVLAAAVAYALRP